MDENLEFHIKVSLKCLICQLLQLLHGVVFSSNSQDVMVKVRMMGWDNYSNFWFWRIKIRSHHCWGCGSSSKASWVKQNIQKQMKMAFAPGIILAPKCRSGPAKASTGHVNTRISSQYLSCFFISSLLVEDKTWLKVVNQSNINDDLSPVWFHLSLIPIFFCQHAGLLLWNLHGQNPGPARWCVCQSHLCL